MSKEEKALWDRYCGYAYPRVADTGVVKAVSGQGMTQARALFMLVHEERVAAAVCEREACARIADGTSEWPERSKSAPNWIIADAIRVRVG